MKGPLAIGSLALAYVFNVLNNAFVVYKTSINKSRIFAPEQFEAAFLSAIDSITKRKNLRDRLFSWFKGAEIKAQRVVIVIDNIDRCDHDIANELLKSIKTFLEVPEREVLFVIPVDEYELQKHLKRSKHNGKEYLRKLFNTSIKIKKFTEGDLFDFVKKLNDKYSLDLSSVQISLIAQEFSRSPRKIIQFINLFQAELELLKRQAKNLRI